MSRFHVTYCVKACCCCQRRMSRTDAVLPAAVWIAPMPCTMYRIGSIDDGEVNKANARVSMDQWNTVMGRV